MLFAEIAIVLCMLLGMNLYTIGPSSGADVVGITVDGNSITLPREELLQSLQLSSGECSISYRNTINFVLSNYYYYCYSIAVRAVSFFFKNLSTLFSDEYVTRLVMISITISTAIFITCRVLSPIISTTLFCGKGFCDTSHAELPRPVRITLNHHKLPEDQNRTTLCSFLVM